MLQYLPIILFGVMLNAVAQLALKQGMRQIGEFEFVLANALPIGWQVGTNPFVALGLLCYVVSVGVWLLVLSRVDVSLAYPMLSIGYVINALIARYWLGESLSASGWAGIGLICCGVVLIARQA